MPYGRTETIFAAISQEGFRRKLELLAKELNCHIYWAEHPSDIFAVARFVSVIDRRILDDDSWSLFERYRAYYPESGKSEPFILIDDGPPSSLALRQVPILTEDDDSEEKVLRVIRILHDTIDPFLASEPPWYGNSSLIPRLLTWIRELSPGYREVRGCYIELFPGASQETDSETR